MVTKKEKKEVLIGRVSHFFDKIKVAVFDLEKPLKVGDRIRIEGGETNFEQEVKSMEIDHKKVKKAKKGDPVAVLVDKKVHEGYRVYKL